jgi:hypothetical protein
MFKYGYLNVSGERNFNYNISNFNIGFRYEFPFAQTSLSATSYDNTTVLSQSASGSIMYEARPGHLGFSNRTSVGKGGITILPYLDINCNGKREKDEPKVSGLNLHISSGRIEKNKRDTTIRVSNLEPYTEYFIELVRNSFDNVAWQIQKQTIRVTIDPNQFKLIEVPVSVLGEVSGMVYISDNKGRRGQGRIIVHFFRSDSSLAATTLTEADGFFSFLGLAPGSYTARIDTAQLGILHLVSSPEALPFTIKHNKDGDVADGLEFVLH